MIDSIWESIWCTYALEYLCASAPLRLCGEIFFKGAISCLPRQALTGHLIDIG